MMQKGWMMKGKKKIRRRPGKKQNLYFTAETQEWIELYQKTEEVDKKTLIYEKNILPAFDILVSGNDKVIKHVTKLGIKADYLPRSKGIGYSGTEIRTLFKTGID